MEIIDFSGQINGLIILSSLSFVFTQFLQGRQREDGTRINGLVESLGTIVANPTFWFGNDYARIKARFDLLSSRRLGNFSVELFTLFIIVTATVILKFGDAVCNLMRYPVCPLYITRGIVVVTGLFLIWILIGGIHSFIVRTKTHLHEAAVRRFHADLSMINPNIPDI